MKSEETISIKKVAEHILVEECKKCAGYSNYAKCDKKSECLESWKEEINRWQYDSL